MHEPLSVIASAATGAVPLVASTFADPTLGFPSVPSKLNVVSTLAATQPETLASNVPLVTRFGAAFASPPVRSMAAITTTTKLIAATNAACMRGRVIGVLLANPPSRTVASCS